ncbi:MAG: phosphoesterase [Akkermansiaceae bacterium]|nr:phosphoesterase [Akkermansiaceae bacterium]
MKTFRDQPVVYIAGNHEYYGERFPGLIAKLQEEAKGSNIHVLENEVFDYGGYRIFGGTLWTDLALFGDPLVGSMDALRMNDYKYIRHSVTYRKLQPVDTRMRHALAVGAIGSFLAAGDPRRSVVVTHHAPSPLSLHGHRRHEPVSCAYASRLEGLIMKHEPLLWTHGHIHTPQTYRIGGTRILANPRGYYDREDSGFNPNLVVDLDDVDAIPAFPSVED